MLRLLTIASLILLVAVTALSNVPRTISYQGRLTENGVPVNGPKMVIFTIYDGSSNPIWLSGWVGVSFTEGLFTVELGQSPQPSLPLENWSNDTAMSLGVTIHPNPELTPRLKFKTAPYAIHALTAERANSGAGWYHDNGLLTLEDPNDSISIGSAIPGSKVAITATNNLSGLRIRSAVTDVWSPALEVASSDVTTAIFRQGTSGAVPAVPIPAAHFVSNGANKNAMTIESYYSSWPAVMIDATGSGDAIRTAALFGYGIDAWFGKGIRAAGDSATAIRAESNYGDDVAAVISSAYTGLAARDHIAVSGYSRPADFWGVGGRFEGGYYGVQGLVFPTSNQGYVGALGLVSGGGGNQYGVWGQAEGTGINVGVFGSARNGTSNWAGYFEGDINVTGSVTKSAGALTIDHPTDPEGELLQQAEVVSDNLSAVYSGNVTLDANGAATVQLPKYTESFCTDFRYQLTCIGGYAPVYVSSEIAGNQFSIAGGKDGLKVSWQITGIRKDKYAQANPLEVEKRKSASEVGKYLHPELYGYGAERSLSPGAQTNAAMKAKDDAIRAATEALKKPSTPPAQPQTVEKK